MPKSSQYASFINLKLDQIKNSWRSSTGGNIKQKSNDDRQNH